MGAACGILIVGASLAAAAGGPDTTACALSFDDSGLARLQVAQPVEASVKTLCGELRRVMEDRPALAAALARHDAQLSLHVQTPRPNRMVVQLILHADGRDLPGEPLTLNQIDGGTTAFDSATLNRLVRHLVDAPQIQTFSQKP